MTVLGEFDGKDVVGTRIAITRAGDGLSKALRTEPRLITMGDRVFVVLECEVTKVGFEETKDDPTQVLRTHTLRAGTATFIDEDLVKEMIVEQAEKNRLFDEAAKGIRNLGDWAVDAQALVDAHEAGDHVDVMVPGCQLCEEQALPTTNVKSISNRKRKNDDGSTT
jgi:hypothetical protein